VSDALEVAAAVPGGHKPAPEPERQSDIEEAAISTISSVKGIANLMRQAQEVSAMLPSRRERKTPTPPVSQKLPKTNLEVALTFASRLPVKPSSNPEPKAVDRHGAVAAMRAFDGAQGLIWPVEGMIYSTFHAKRGRREHGAIDIVTKRGTPIAAAADGMVSVAASGGRNFKGYGKIIIIDHGKGLYTVYAHCDTLLVKMGQRVKQGEFIATVGRTGRATTDHCHFEVRISGKKHDPLAYLPSRPDMVKANDYRSPRSKRK
jgi:murein DD-endopeptidase MepM/ murein hydrolase activator NlpD